MASFSGSDDLRGAEFVGVDLRDARFVGVDLSGAVMRGVDVTPFVQTLRHLVLATDAWLGKGIWELGQPFHQLGLADPSAADDGLDMSIFTTLTPSYAEVLEVRADRVAMTRDFLAIVPVDELATARRNPWNPDCAETTRSCLHVILQEEWEHHRHAVRDLDAIEAGLDV